MKPTNARRQGGFTLIEVLIASAVLAFVVAALAHAVVAGQMQTADSLHAMRGAALAEAMMEEILSKPYADPEGATTLGPDAGESARSSFDNMDDYHGYTEAAGAVVDASGTGFGATHSKFSRNVSITAQSLQPSGFTAAIPGLRIVVTVTAGSRTWQVTRFVPEPAS